MNPQGTAAIERGRGTSGAAPASDSSGAVLSNGHLRVVQVFEGWSAPRCVKCAPIEKRTIASAAALVVDDNTGQSFELCRQHSKLLGLVPQPVNGALYFGRELAYVVTHEQRRAIEEVPLEVMAAELRCKRASVVPFPTVSFTKNAHHVAGPAGQVQNVTASPAGEGARA